MNWSKLKSPFPLLLDDEGSSSKRQKDGVKKKKEQAANSKIGHSKSTRNVFTFFWLSQSV